MRIGKTDNAYSAISTSTPEAITVRGYDLCEDLIGQIDFTSYFWLLTTGEMPNDTQKFFCNAVLTCIAEHGLVPSVVATRMTYAAAPEAFQGAVAAGLLGCGSVVLGSAEESGKFYAGLVAQDAQDTAALCHQAILDLRAEKKTIPGFGHPLHSEGDPRANLLFKLAEEKGIVGPHIKMVHQLKEVMPDAIGKNLPINVNGAIPSVMLDVGYPLAALKGISLLARTASLIGHLQEETERSIGFIMSHKAAEAISYDGK
ncbi:MAG: citryl-CoA lyase [Parvibaculales bacterium]